MAAAMASVIAALGGVRATLFATLAALLAVVASAQAVSLGDAKSDLSELRASVALSTAASADAIAAAERRARERNEELSAAYILAASNYDRGVRNAEDAGARVVADLRADNLRLHRRWTDAEARARDLSAAAADSGAPDAAAEDRAESAARIVRAAAECDAQVRALQDIVRAVSSLSGEAR